jgi:hypothetical protein
MSIGRNRELENIMKSVFLSHSFVRSGLLILGLFKYNTSITQLKKGLRLKKYIIYFRLGLYF